MDREGRWKRNVENNTLINIHDMWVYLLLLVIHQINLLKKIIIFKIKRGKNNQLSSQNS